MAAITQTKSFPCVDTVIDVTDEDTSTNGTAFSGYGELPSVDVTLDVTATAGGTLDVTIEDSADGLTWATLGTFTQAAGVTSETITLTTPNEYLRANWLIQGIEASFDFSIVTDPNANTLANQVGEDEATDTAAVAGYSGANFLIAQLDVTAVSGTLPTLNLHLEHSLDGETWLNLNTALGTYFSEVSAAGTQTIVFPNCLWGDYIRAHYQLGGDAPCFDFTLKLFAKN